MRYALLPVLGLLLIAAGGCSGSDGASVVPTPTTEPDLSPPGRLATPRPRPTASPLPVAPATGIAVVDAFVGAAIARDIDRVVQMMVFAHEPCGKEQGNPGPPECPPGVPVGTLVEAFQVVICDGGMMNRPTAEQHVRAQLDRPPELWAIARSSGVGEDWEHRVTLLLKGNDADVLLDFHLRSDGIVSMWGCSASLDLRTPEPGIEYIVPPPALR